MNTKKSKLLILFLSFLTIILVTSCSSIQDAIPQLTIVGDPTIVEFEIPSKVTIPIIGIVVGSGNTTGKLVVRLPVEAFNRNSSPLKITKLEYDLYLKDNLIATGMQDNRVDIDSNGRSRFDLDVTVPIDKALDASSDLVTFYLGTAMPVKVDATVTVDILGITKVSIKHEVFNQVMTAPPIELPEGLPF